MKKLLLLFSLLLMLSCNKPSGNDAYIMNKQLVESHLYGEISEIDFPFSDFRFDDLKNGSFIIESSFEGKNNNGANVKVNYRSKLKYKGQGDKHDIQNWELLDFTILE